MSYTQNADGRIVLNYEGISYLCEIGRHCDCGGFCKCRCHKRGIE